MTIRLNGSVSTIAIVLAATCPAITPAFAAEQEPGSQPIPEQKAEEKETPAAEIVVTGSAIRGVAPIGSNLVTLDQEAVAKTGSSNLSELINTVPAMTTAGSEGLGENVFSYYSPQIHQLAGSASNSTLVVIDGLRVPGAGIRYGQSDPNIIPISAIQRVEVLADGASSIYGSDAVAGVVNYITRPSYSGAKIAARTRLADSWHSIDVNGIVGAGWSTGDIYVAFQHVYASPLATKDRDFLSLGDFRPVGGRNTQTFNCMPATIRTAATGTTRAYLSPSATTPTELITDNAPCNNSIYGDALNSSKRSNGLIRLNQSFGDRLSVSGTVNYNVLESVYRFGPALVNNVTVFGPGSTRVAQINPFYVAPAGEPTVTQQIVSFAAIKPDNYYGTQVQESETLYLYGDAEYELSDSWTVTLSDAYGDSTSFSRDRDTICTTCVRRALNGTVNANGSANAANPAIPLTTANALDVWQANAGRTSAAVLDGLYTNQGFTRHINRFNQVKLEAQGVLFALPAGDVRLAVGGEYYWAEQKVLDVDASGEIAFDLERKVLSGYVELAVPLVSEDMGVPLVRRLDLSLSGRHDRFSDVTDTTNPKIAATWEVIEGLRLRGNYATAFVAPPMATIGVPELGYRRRAAGVTNSGAFFVPLDIYPDARLLPGCAAAVTVCQIGTSVNPGLTRDYGIGPNAKPQTGNSWSIGVDFAPPQIPGLEASLTFWSNKFRDGVNRLEVTQQLYSVTMRDRLTICPTGCTTAQINEFGNVANGGSIDVTPPAIVYFMNNNDMANVLNLDVQGIDGSFNYQLRTRDIGKFTFGATGTYYTRFDQNTGGEAFDVLNTSGFNSGFPSIQTRLRFQLGWDLGGFSLDGFVTHTGSYLNWGNAAVTPLILDENNRPIGGGDVVKADTRLDLNAAYRLKIAKADARLFVNVNNVFDSPPPFFSGTMGRTHGINRYVSNAYGRTVSLGFSVEY